jgi:hypothetical protein
MTALDRARIHYRDEWLNALRHDDWCALYRGADAPACEMADHFWLRVDAASIVLDLAVAESAARRSVAWG